MSANETPANNGPPEGTNMVGGRYDRIKAVEEARKALLARKRISVRVQIFLAFFLVFMFAAAIAVALIVTNSQVEFKLRLLEVTNEFTVEIVQARRFEKNFFLYGTNLDDALDNVYRARDVLERNPAELAKVLGRNRQEVILSNIDRYQGLLERLVQMEQSEVSGPNAGGVKKEIEMELRKTGRKMVFFAQDLMKKERASLARILSISRRIHIFALVFLLIFLLLNCSFLGRRILGNITRFGTYAQRIASGNFTPITPARRYQDEFTDLAIAINQMIQELESREAILIQSHKMRAVGTLTAGVAHELNNPLNNITLTAHMLLEDYDDLDENERKEMLKDVVSEANRSRDIISNLLDFARESGSQLEPIDLAKLLKDTIRLASNQVKLSGIKIEFHATENLPRVHGDTQQLQQVFLNIIQNAVDVSAKAGKIQVLVLPADEPNYVAVKVIDFGTGIPAHILSSIFDPFFTTKGKGKGTGLGLSVSQGIVGKHGGQIRVSSKEGAGSTFTVTLPVTTFPAEINV